MPLKSQPDERTQAEDFSMREVHDSRGGKDHNQADGQQAIDQSYGEAVEDLLSEHNGSLVELFQGNEFSSDYPHYRNPAVFSVAFRTERNRSRYPGEIVGLCQRIAQTLASRPASLDCVGNEIHAVVGLGGPRVRISIETSAVMGHKIFDARVGGGGNKQTNVHCALECRAAEFNCFVINGGLIA